MLCITQARVLRYHNKAQFPQLMLTSPTKLILYNLCVCARMCVSMRVCVCAYVCACVCVCVCMCVCVCARACVCLVSLVLLEPWPDQPSIDR